MARWRARLDGNWTSWPPMAPTPPRPRSTATATPRCARSWTGYWPTRPHERAARPRAEELPKSVAKALRKLDRRLAAAQALPAGPERDEALHEARKADKLLRYVTEIATPVIGKPARWLGRQAKKLQDLLGDYQDAVVARPLLHKLGATAVANGQPVGTYLLVDALEQIRTERVLAVLPNRLSKGAWPPSTATPTTSGGASGPDRE